MVWSKEAIEKAKKKRALLKATSLDKRNKLTPSKQPIDLIIRQTYEKLQVLFLKLDATLVEVRELREETRTLRSLHLTLLADPQAREDAEAVIRKFIQERTT